MLKAFFLRCVALHVLTVSLAMVSTGSAQVFTKIYDFGPFSPAPYTPGGTLAQGRDGILYGTTHDGGFGVGTVFKITPAGTLTTLYEFDNAHGQIPAGGVTLGTDGNLYGVTTSGGTGGWGTVFRITPLGKLTVLHNFTRGEDGGIPEAPLLLAADGNFYGTTTTAGPQGNGTVFKITPSGKLTTVYGFNYADGVGSYGALVQAIDGKLYGTATNGGIPPGFGTAFRVTTSGGFTVLYSFDNTHGSFPFASLAERDDGSFYGTASQGGTHFVYGTLFKLTRKGKLTVIHNFSGSEGSNPANGLTLATDGNFYGVTGLGGFMNYGTIYRIGPGIGFSDVYTFDGTTGAGPYVTLIQHTNGLLYGDAGSGGAYNKGTFYSVDISASAFAGLVLTSGKVGKTIGILGQGFTGTTEVSFNGTPASFAVIKDTFLKATVPAGATTGFVTVTTPSGMLKSNKQFRVKP